MQSPENFLPSLAGDYAGTHSVWFEPGDPVDVGMMAAEVTALDISGFMEIAYSFTFQGKSHAGRMTLGYSKAESRYQLSWLDSFHSAGRILHCEGEPGASQTAGFSVSGTYPADATSYWGWRIAITKPSSGGILIQHYNLMPGEAEALGVEMRLT